jgi:hypothetical protein
MPPAMGAIHLVSSSPAAGQLIGAGARKRIYSDDKLTSGPCDVDPARHAELRRAWDIEVAGLPGIGWRKPLDLATLRAAIAGDEPVVLWGTRAFSDLVWLWWALDGLRRVGAEGSRFFLARPYSDHPFATVGHLPPETAHIALAAASPITDDEWREGSELWLQYASPSPLAFDEARRRGSSVFPELTSSADLHGAWFPRIKNGRLQLSELDEVLLGSFDDSWRTAFQKLPEHRVEQLVSPFDAYFSVERLRAWATHGVLERESVTDDNPFEQDRFRTTDRARALLSRGLEGVADAPPMHVGGCRVNDPSSPWVRIEADSGWRLAAQGGP